MNYVVGQITSGFFSSWRTISFFHIKLELSILLALADFVLLSSFPPLILFDSFDNSRIDCTKGYCERGTVLRFHWQTLFSDLHSSV